MLNGLLKLAESFFTADVLKALVVVRAAAEDLGRARERMRDEAVREAIVVERSFVIN